MNSEFGKELTEQEITGAMTFVTVDLRMHFLTHIPSVLLFAATDTTASILSRILHVLALNPGWQQKLRDEILQVRVAKGDMEIDELNRLPFLDAVCRECLRL